MLSRGNLRKTKLFPKIVSLSSGDPDLSFTEYVVTSLYRSIGILSEDFFFFFEPAQLLFFGRSSHFFSAIDFFVSMVFEHGTNR